MQFPNTSAFDPTTCISSKIARLNRLTSSIFRKHITPFGITTSQLSLLFILTRAGGLSQKHLSDRAKLEKSSLNRNLKRLVEDNYLTKHNFPIINLTQKGKQLVEKVIPAWDEAMKEIRLVIEHDGEVALDLILSKMLTKNEHS